MNSHSPDMSLADPSVQPSPLERIAAGDPAAVADCLSLYGRLVWSLARRYTPTFADAEDATQEVFLSVWTHAKAFDRTKGTEIGFVATIARRRLIDRRRRGNVDLSIDCSIDVADAPDMGDPDATWQREMDAQKVADVFAQLRPEWRIVLEFGLVQGLTQVEIAARLHVPLGTVKAHMRRGILHVRNLLKIDAALVPAFDKPSAPATLPRRIARRPVAATRNLIPAPVPI